MNKNNNPFFPGDEVCIPRAGIKKLRHLLLLSSFPASLFISAAANAGDFGEILLAKNLQETGTQAQADKKPVVLFVTASDCPFCQTLHEEIFQFLPQDPRFKLRELEIDGSHNIYDFSGKSVAPRALAKHYTPNLLTPTVLFVDGNGQEIAESLIGVLTLDFYNYYFEKNLETAVKAAQQNTQP